MPAEPTDRPVPDPDEIAGQSFTRTRKGFEVDEVRAYLVSLASQVRDAQLKQAEDARRIAELERRATDPRDLDEAQVTQLLGEETGRVLETARQAAADIRTKAEETASATTSTASEEARATREAADQYAQGVRSTADEYASTTRSAAEAEVAEQRAAAATESEAMRAAAETVLAERTAEAEEAASEIRTEVDAYAASTREAADTYAADTRAATDAAAAEVRADVDAYAAREREAADAYAAATRSEADNAAVATRDDAARVRAEADEAAAARVASSADEVEAILDAARDQGRAMVDEARAYRERVIADLADRRRVARAQLDQLAASRDALSVTLTDVAARIEASHRALDETVVDPRSLGDVTADRAALAESDPEPEPEPEPDPEPEPEPERASDPVEAMFAQLKAQRDDERPPAPEVVEAPPGEGSEVADAADNDVLDRRDAATDELERQLARRLKRVLSDEQNEALDRLRRIRGQATADEVLLSQGEHLGRYHAAALEDLVVAERTGAAFFGEAPKRSAYVGDVAGEFAADLVRQLRGRLEAAFDDGGDEAEISDRIRSCYREWKTQRIADAAAHYVLVAFNRGVAEAAAADSGSRWVVDDGGTPCPDCDDNALAGAVPKGEAFPTGDLHPPAHPGCRCLAVPV